MSKEYVNVKEIHPGYTTIPCKECDGSLWVDLSFAYNHDEWYCKNCKPQRLKDISGGWTVPVVRI